MEPDRNGLAPESAVVQRRRWGAAFVWLGVASPALVFVVAYARSGSESDYAPLFAGAVAITLGSVLGGCLLVIGAVLRRSSRKLAGRLDQEATLARPPVR